MAEIDLFLWWAASISGGSIFLTLVSIYLYVDSRPKRKADSGTKRSFNVLPDFVFVWVLLGLLVFYIASINIGSAAVFAAGNVVVEILLLIYLMKNKMR